MFILRLPRMRTSDIFNARQIRFLVALSLLYAATCMLFADEYILARLLELMVCVLMLGLAIMCAAIPRDFKQLQVICLASTVGGGIIGSWVLLFGAESLADKARDINRLYISGMNENALAYILATGLFLSGIAWYGAGLKTKLLILFNDIMATIAIGLSGSRAVWVALVAAIFTGVLLAKRVKIKFRILFLVVSVLSGVVGYFVVFAIAPDRVEYMIHRVGMIDARFSGGRVQFIWPIWWEAFLSNPLLGSGAGTSRIVNVSAHNDLLHTLGSGGLLGFIFFIGMYIVMLRDARRNIVPWLRIVSVSGIVFCFTFGLAHTTILQKSFAAFVGITACMTNLGMCPAAGSPGSFSGGRDELVPDPQYGNPRL